jgi:hypothetical protein
MARWKAPVGSTLDMEGKTKEELDVIKAYLEEDTGAYNRFPWDPDVWIRLRVAYKVLGLNMDGSPYSGDPDFNAGPE